MADFIDENLLNKLQISLDRLVDVVVQEVLRSTVDQSIISDFVEEILGDSEEKNDLRWQECGF